MEATRHDDVIDTEDRGEAWAMHAANLAVLLAAGTASNVELIPHELDQAYTHADPPRDVRER